jgi:hypothetical protein
VERRRGLDEGKMVVATVYRGTFYALLVFNVIMTISVLNLTFFAKKGPRYTADDGARERQERIASDQALAARIDYLHNQLAERVSTDDL